MLRTYHRWLSLFLAPFLIWTAVTGLVIQYNHVMGTDERKGPSATELAVTHPGFTCPADLTCRLKSRPGQMDWRMEIKHLHAGQPFGPIGTALSILSGLSLAFFAGTGLWLYAQMWSNRAARALSPRWFWK